ncbi:MAG: N-acetyl-gamma-glutamyl-phosphate reductase [Bacteroidales bacterium]|nr:N-acetyl-gamma-glutamyl-phosphate reductase [Bacteroidales bacterium]
MIRTGIVGGDSKEAGDIIRILINHPDVELAWVEAPENEGILLSHVHPGLTGETYMRFCSAGDPSQIDALFLCYTAEGDSERYLSRHAVPDSVKIVDLSPDFRLDGPDSPWVFGLAELNRKPLVRGAKKASIPGPYATAVLLGLLPLAKNLLLTSDIHVAAVGPASSLVAPGEPIALLDYDEVDEISYGLKQLQSSFNSPIHFVATAGGWHQGIATTIYLNINVGEDEIKDLYDQFYEDHSFTFVTEACPDLREVIGTNKCGISLQKVDNTLAITTVIDDRLKGKASAAVHAMNLLFGLQERVGLMLKALAD